MSRFYLQDGDNYAGLGLSLDLLVSTASQAFETASKLYLGREQLKLQEALKKLEERRLAAVEAEQKRKQATEQAKAAAAAEVARQEAILSPPEAPTLIPGIPGVSPTILIGGLALIGLVIFLRR